jgi:hypothetical protein
MNIMSDSTFLVPVSQNGLKKKGDDLESWGNNALRNFLRLSTASSSQASQQIRYPQQTAIARASGHADLNDLHAKLIVKITDA